LFFYIYNIIKESLFKQIKYNKLNNKQNNQIKYKIKLINLSNKRIELKYKNIV